MKQNTCWYRFVWRLAIALILAVCLWLVSPLPAAAQSIEESFQLTYEPVSFSKSEVHGSEAFSATIQGRATCTKDLPLPISEASITSHIIAEHKVSGATITLNSSYTVTIKPFPSKKGDTAEINQVVPLKFPAQAESGDYNIIGQIIEAKVKVAFVWVEVTEYLHQPQLMGSLKYIAPESPSTSEPTTISTPEPTTTSTPESTTPTPTQEPAPPEAPVSIEYVIPWWVWLIVAIAVATTAVNIVWFLRQRIL